MQRVALAAAYLLAVASHAACSDESRSKSDLCDANEDCASGLCFVGQCLSPDGDDDGDGLTNGFEAGLGSNPLDPDTDGDSRRDGDELDEARRANVDHDQDGKPDVVESATRDDDGDCIPDQFDAQDAVVNSDLSPMTDVVCSARGICADQRAHLGVSCATGVAACVYDDVPGFADPEASCDGLDENCDGVADEGFPDRDSDGVADCVDLDWDNDSIVDTVDNCPARANPLQPDADADGLGDDCTADYTFAVTGPASTIVGLAFSASATLVAIDPANAPPAGPPLPPFHGQVTAALDPGTTTPAPTLTGETARPTQDHVALFDDLVVTAPGTALVLVAASGAITPGRSDPFDATLDGTHCTTPEQCPSGVCDPNLCQPPTCTDHVQNGDESGVDCGAQTTCGLCPADATCELDADCTSGDCQPDLRCAPPPADDPPSAPTVAITPLAPTTTDDLVATLTTPSVDPEGAVIHYTYAWSKDGVLVPALTSDTVPASATAAGETWSLDVLPDDGTQTGPAGHASVTIANAPPRVTLVTLAPALPNTADVLTATATATDPDGDPVTLGYAWYRGAELLVGQTARTLDGANFVRGDTVRVVVSCSDAHASGTPGEASTVIVNARPTVASVAIAPSAPALGDTLTCAYNGFADADGDPDHSRIAWTLDGQPANTGATFTGTAGIGARVACIVTPDDGIDPGTLRVAEVVIGNHPPAVDTLAIAPNPARRGDALTASATASDPDGQTVTLRYAWYVGPVGPVGAEQTLPANLATFAKGDLVRVVVTPRDGLVDGPPAEASVTIVNTPPSYASAKITPSAPLTTDTLTCAGVGYADRDDDPPAAPHVAWTIDGAPSTVTAATLPGPFAAGAAIACSIAPDDGTESGLARTASVVIGNRPPTIVTATLSPTTPRTNDVLSLAVTTQDLDLGDTVTLTYAWFVGAGPGGPVGPVGTGATLDGKVAFARDDLVTVVITPHDGHVAGDPVERTVTILDSAPSAAAPVVTPANPTRDDDLTCAVSGFSDPDAGDTDHSSYVWDVDNVQLGTGPVLAAPHPLSAIGKNLRCTATAHDGTLAGNVGSAVIQIRNRLPVVTQLAITPNPLYTDATAQADATATDADGDTVTLTYAWTVNGTAAGSGPTLDGALFKRGDAVAVTVTPNDGRADGPPSSASVFVANAPPTIETATLSPTLPRTNDVLSAALTTADRDGDNVVVAHQWQVAGVNAATSTTLEGANAFAKGQLVKLILTPHDGTVSGPPVERTVTIQNTPPILTALAITPAELRTDDLAGASYQTHDDDGDPVSVAYAWTVAGAAAGTTATLDGTSAFAKNQLVGLAATPHDGTAAGLAQTASKTVQNSLPTAPDVAFVDPYPMQGKDDLVCALLKPAVDPDGDPVSHAFTWARGLPPVAYTGATKQTVRPGDSIDKAVPAGGEHWECTVTPSETSGTDGPGPAATDAVDVECSGLQAQSIIAFTGLKSDGLGIAGWNTVAGAPEPERTGHSLGAIHWCLGPQGANLVAYYYIATRDFIEAVPGGLRATGVSALPATAAAMSANGFAASDLIAKFSTANLGADIQGQDWTVAGSVETRFYQGATFTLTLAGQPLVRFEDCALTVQIDYGVVCQAGDESIGGVIDYVTPLDASQGSSAAVQAVATAFLDDLGYRQVKFRFDQLAQPAIDASFSSNGRNGGYFSAVSSGADTEGTCLP